MANTMRTIGEEREFNYQVVEKIIGYYTPTGESREDLLRLERFEKLLYLTQDLIDEIDEFVWRHKNFKEASIQIFVEKGEKFLEQFKVD